MRRRSASLDSNVQDRGFQEVEQADSSLPQQNESQNIQPKSRRTNGPEEKSLTEFDYNKLNAEQDDGKRRKLVVEVFHKLVNNLRQEHDSLNEEEHDTLNEEDNKKTMRVFDRAAAECKTYCEDFRSDHLGSVPGVEVGNTFQSRKLLSILGLHPPPQAGIYYVKSTIGGKETLLATSIVLSGRYEDDVDNGDTIIYAGEGGKDPVTSKQIADQKFERGNAALETSFKKKQPVRLIRSCYEMPSLYRYDGLYNVEKCWPGIGTSGFRVYFSKLKRQENQPHLGFKRVHFKKITELKNRSLIPTLIQKDVAIKQDITETRENFDIPVINTVDEVYTLDDFEYLLSVQYRGFLPKPELLEGCSCPEGCTDAKNCLCARRNGGQFPYTEKGTLVAPKVVVFECGKKCKCPSTCKNRVAQHGLKRRLEIFRTRNRTGQREWAVRAVEFIEAGEFIGEYTGDIILDCSANNSQNKFICPIFSLSMQGNQGDNDVVSVSSFQFGEGKGYKVDASLSGNVCRFIRWDSPVDASLSGNVFAQYVLYDHHDTDIPHVMLFAYDNIPERLELLIDSSAKTRNTSQKTIHSRSIKRIRQISKGTTHGQLKK